MPSSMSGSGGIKATGYNLVQTPRMSSANMSNWNQANEALQQRGGINQVTDYYSKLAGGDSEMFEQMEAPAWRDFAKAQGKTASRFSNAGLGGRRSSGFANVMGGAQADLAARLQGSRMDLQRQGVEGLRGMYKDLMNNDPYEQSLIEDKKSGWNKWIGASLPWIGAAGGALAGSYGGPGGALAGAKIGGTAGSYGAQAFFD